MEQTSPKILPIFIIFTFALNTSPTHTLTPPIAPTQPPTTSPSKAPPTSTTTTSSTLDPKQLRALQSLNVPTTKDPCSNPHSTTIHCDNSKPFRHITSLHLTNCTSDVSLSITALKSLSTLTDLQFIDCPVAPVNFPAELTANLKSFTCVNSLRKLTGVWLSHLENVTDLNVSHVPVKASGPVIILGKLKKVTKVTLSHANLTGNLPGKSWNSNTSYINLSGNLLKGRIPSSITELDNLETLDLSSNQLTGELPTTIGDLISLKNLSVSSNSLSGSIPDSFVSIPSLVYLDLSSNQFNGTIPKFLSKMKSLKYLNLEKNNFQGVLPFTASFIKTLEVFKVGENANLCYNHTTIYSKAKLGIAPCDKNGLPITPPSAKSPSGGGDDGDYSDDGSSSEDSTSQKGGGHHGPNKVVLGVAIALSSIVFLIIFLILLSRKCA